MAAGAEIIEACVAAGGVLSGEHGIGLEKRDYMGADLQCRRPRRPGPAAGRVRPGRQSATRTRCCRRARAAATCSTCPTARGCEPRRRRPGDRTRSPTRSAPSDPVVPCRRADAVGRRRRAAGRRARGACRRPASSTFEPAEMIVRVRAGTTVAELDAVLAEGGQMVAARPGTRPGRRSAACSPSAAAACGASVRARCATRCSRSRTCPPRARSSRPAGRS